MKYPGQESITLEFKSTLPKNDQIIKTVIAFCNQHGGKLILGVADDGTIIGLDEDQAIATMEYLEHAIFTASSPPIIPNIILQRVNNKILLVVQVSEGMNKPYYRHAEGLTHGTYVRIGKNTMRASSDMIEELKWRGRGLAYENLAIYQASKKELDLAKISDFLANRRHANGIAPNNTILLSYKLLVEEHSKFYPTIAGILLFGRRVQYFLPEAMIICSQFKGTEGPEAIAALDCTGTLFEQFAQAYHFIVSHLTYSFTIKHVKREEKLEIPPLAIREMLLNAIIHRNYHLRSPSKIAIYDDRVEIFSPGNFPTPLPSLHLGLTNTRNMTICKIFREANLIEKLGSGFLTLFASYQAWQLPEPIVEEGDGFVKCILPRATYHDAINSGNDTQKILALFDVANELSVSDVMKIHNMPRSSASRKLAALVQQGILTTTGTGKGTRYSKVY